MEKKNVLFLSKLQSKSGNYMTAMRLKSYIESAGFQCFLKDPKFLQIRNFSDFLKDNKIGIIFAIHAYHSGKILQDLPSNIDYVIILGGTDINECWQEADKLKVMTKVIKNAKFVVGFNKTMIDLAKTLWTSLESNSFLEIPQAVMTCPSGFSLRTHLQTSGHSLAFSEPLHIFLIVGGIRPVKDPLFLVQTFEDWHKKQRNCLLVILGPCLDEAYHREFLNKIKNLKAVVYIPGLSPQDTHACIKTSFAFVNSSISEGMSTAILEAMELGVPIIARDIPGNSRLIKDKRNGLLYTTPQEFISKCETLLSDDNYRSTLIKTAQKDVFQNHNVEREAEMYIEVLNVIQSERMNRT